MTINGELKKQGLECSFQVIISNEAIEKRSIKAANEYFKKNTPRGFRRGMIPVGYKSNEFRSSALQMLINQSVTDRIKELELKPFVEPNIDLKQNEIGKDVICQVEIINLPEPDFTVYEKHEIETLQYQIPEEEVTNSKSRLLDDFGKWESVESAIEEGYGISIKFTGLDDKQLRLRYTTESDSNKAFIKKTIESIVTNSTLESDKQEKCIEAIYKTILGLENSKKGEIIQVKGFEDIKLTIEEVYDIKAPDLTAEFLRQIGVADAQESTLNKSLRELLEYQTTKKVDEYYYKQFTDFCNKSVILQVPESLVEKEQKKSKEQDKLKITENLKLNIIISSLLQYGQIEIDEKQVEVEINFQINSMGGYAKQHDELYSLLKNYARNTVATNQAIEFAMTKMQQSNKEIGYLELDSYLKKHMD